jgi:hypothetical protein
MIAFDFSDPGTGDATSAAGWQFTITWGDGLTTTGSARPPGGVTANHRYSQSGKYTVKVEVKDKDGGVGTSKTLSIRVG